MKFPAKLNKMHACILIHKKGHSSPWKPNRNGSRDIHIRGRKCDKNTDHCFPNRWAVKRIKSKDPSTEQDTEHTSKQGSEHNAPVSVGLPDKSLVTDPFKYNEYI